MGTVGLPPRAAAAAWTWVSIRRASAPATRTSEPTVFSCGAARNKRCRSALESYPGLPYLWIDFMRPGPARAAQASRSGGPTPGVAPARATLWVAKAVPCSPLSLSVSAWRPSPRGAPRLGDEAGDPLGRKSNAPFFQIRPRRAPHAPLWRRSRRGRRFCESLYSLSLKALSRVRPTAAPLSLRHTSRRPPKKEFHSFCGEQNRDEIPF